MGQNSPFDTYFDTFRLNQKLCATNPLFTVPDSYGQTYHKGVEEACSERRLLNFRDGTPENKQIGTNYPGNIRANYSDKAYQDGQDYLKKEWEKLSKRIDPIFTEQANDNTVGNPLQFNFIPNRVITEYLFRHLYYVGMMAKLVNLDQNQGLVLEIGGGFGNICKLFFDFGLANRYIIIDLPKSLLIEEYFLKTTFPEKKIGTSQNLMRYLADFESIPENELLNWDILLLPPCFLPLFPDHAVDLVINTHSMMEMNLDQIEFYYEQINRLCRGYFYQCNRQDHKLNQNYTYKNWPIDATQWQVTYLDQQWQYRQMVEMCLKKETKG